MIKNQIKLHQKNIKYTLRVSARARQMRLAIYCDGNFVVTVPQNVSANIIEQFIITKAQWILNKLEYFKSIAGRVFPGGNKKEYLQYKDKAQVLAQERIGYFNQTYNFKFHKINIKNQKSRWGSCSKKGNLNFNYKIALLSARLADYIIVHELCHLGEFNHSRKFWNLVACVIPDYLARRNELKKNRIKK
jgi:hypothetical protein